MASFFFDFWRQMVVRRLGGPQNPSGRSGEQKNLLSLPLFEFGVVKPIASLLHRLLLVGVRCRNIVPLSSGYNEDGGHRFL